MTSAAIKIWTPMGRMASLRHYWSTESVLSTVEVQAVLCFFLGWIHTRTGFDLALVTPQQRQNSYETKHSNYFKRNVTANCVAEGPKSQLTHIQLTSDKMSPGGAPTEQPNHRLVPVPRRITQRRLPVLVGSRDVAPRPRVTGPPPRSHSRARRVAAGPCLSAAGTSAPPSMISRTTASRRRRPAPCSGVCPCLSATGPRRRHLRTMSSRDTASCLLHAAACSGVDPSSSAAGTASRSLRAACAAASTSPLSTTMTSAPLSMRSGQFPGLQIGLPGEVTGLYKPSLRGASTRIWL